MDRVRQAVLLVGGRGTRLWPLTESVPKGLIPVAGMPFVELQLRLLGAAGIEQVWLAIGAEHRAAWERFVAARDGLPRLELSVEEAPLDTAGPVTMLLDRLDERFLVLNGDIVIDTQLSRFIDTAPRTGAALALVRVEDPSAYGVVVVDDDGIVQRFVEKPAPGSAPADTVSAGIYVVERRVLEEFHSGPLSFERRVFPDLAAGKELGAAVVDGRWLDIGTPELYLDTHEVILSDGTSLYQADTRHGAAPDAVVAGESHGSWSWVGAGAHVEAGAVIKESVVLDGARVRRGARLVRAVVGWGADVGEGASVMGETVIGRNAVVGAGCELRKGMRVAEGTVLGPRSVTFSPPR